MTTKLKHKNGLINKVRAARAVGMSYKEIADKFDIAKSTARLWAEDVVLKLQDRRRLYTKQIQSLSTGPAGARQRRIREVEDIRNSAKMEIKTVSFESYRIAGAMIYWAEGDKTKFAGFSNADPKLVKFMVRWFERVCNQPPKNLRTHIHLHAGDDERKSKNYWSRLTGIPIKNFGKSFIKPAGSGHRKNVLPNGIIRIRVKGRGTSDLRERILAWAEEFSSKSLDRP